MKKNYLFLILLSALISGCNGCSKSGKIRGHVSNHYGSNSEDSRDKTNIIKNETTTGTGHEADSRDERESIDEFTVKMIKESGVYMVPVEINGSDMKFVFDTGASDITISDIEALFLYKQGKLSKEDILGSQQYQIADGSIAEGTIVNLRTVKIGNQTLKNVKASIVHNVKAPLLLGQSALARFGKVSIDYDKNEISFE